MEELVRAREESSEIDGATVGIRFASAEDTLLYKLVWYRLGGEHSERQWDDVRGILMARRAARLGVLAPMGEIPPCDRSARARAGAKRIDNLIAASRQGVAPELTPKFGILDAF